MLGYIENELSCRGGAFAPVCSHKRPCELSSHPKKWLNIGCSLRWRPLQHECLKEQVR